MILKSDYLIQPYKAMFDAMGYRWFDGAYNVNIFGIRSSLEIPNVFDDFIFLIYQDDNLQWIVKQFEATTQAGLYYMNHPINVDGTAILAPSQYRGVYKIDKHNGKYYALCQRLGKVSVYRDNNRDNKYDYDPSTIQEGKFGVNIHRGARGEGETVDRFSAACQVFKRESDFNEFMRICSIAARRYSNSFTYTLFAEEVEQKTVTAQKFGEGIGALLKGIKNRPK